MKSITLTKLQLDALTEVGIAELSNREASIPDGIRDFLVKQELILPNEDRHHILTDKAKSYMRMFNSDYFSVLNAPVVH